MSRRRQRLADALLVLGLALEAASLLALERPAGFLAFALAGAPPLVAGMALHLWRLLRPAGPPG